MVERKRSKSSARGSRANPSASPGRVAEQTILAGSGPRSVESSATSIPDGSSSRTSPASGPVALLGSSKTLPHSGSMRSGSISARPTWAHRTVEPASSSSPTETEDDSTDGDPPSSEPWPMLEHDPAWPTPAAGCFNDGENPETWLARRELHATKAAGATRASMPLAIAAKLWPTATATATDASASARHGYMITGHSGTTLNDAIREWSTEWPTPTRSDAERGPGSRYMRGNPTLSVAARDHDSRRDPSTAPAGSAGSPTVYLNPSFVEALMGFPIGWTDLPRSETLAFPW